MDVWAEVAIGDLDQFLEVFGTDGADKRAEHGCRGTTVYQPIGDPSRVIVLLSFADQAGFDAFRTDPTAPPIMRRGGAQGPPTFTPVERVAAYDH